MQTFLDGTPRASGGRNGSAESPLIVSNRGPVEYSVDGGGCLHGCRAAGGLATALASGAKSRGVTWIASAVSPGDRRVAAACGAVESEEGGRLRFVAPPADTYDLFYNSFCNPILWFLQHSLCDQLQCPDLEAEALRAWDQGYLPVNQAFGQAVVEELNGGERTAQVMLHDYHLYVAPLFIRNLAPKAVLQHFIHIPWPGPEEWRALPRPITESICEGLLANDSVVFQTQECVDNFILTCEAFLPGIRAECESGEVVRRGRPTRVWANPISVDPSDLLCRLTSPEADECRQRLRSETGERTIVRVDRLDPSKNIVAGFRAFDLLLDRHPEWIGKVGFIACLVPSHTAIPEYRTYADETFRLVEAINRRYGRPGWTPITVHHEHNRLQALVAMSLYDVLLVNSRRDGMNLVSKEGPVVNERDGALVLSVAAGSYEELREGALGVRPDDIVGTAEALHTALLMSPAERRERATLLRQAVIDHDLDRWLRLQFEDLEAAERGALLVGAGVPALV